MTKTLSEEEGAKKEIASRDPMEEITQGMADRGFDMLWTPPEVVTRNQSFHNAFTDKKKIAFLKDLATSGRVVWAAVSAGTTKCTVNKYRRKDPVFNAACDEALEFFRDILKGEMFRRGVEGYEEGVVGGKNRDEIIMVPKFSDRMLERLTSIHFGEGRSGTREGEPEKTATTVVNNQYNFSNLSAEDLEKATQLLENQIKTVDGEEIDDT